MDYIVIGIQDADPQVRKSAFNAIGIMAMRNSLIVKRGETPLLHEAARKDLLPLVRDGLRDPDEQIRAFSLNALTMFTTSADLNLEAALITQYRADNSALVRRQAIARLRQSNTLSSSGQTVLIEAVNDSNDGVKQQAALGLQHHRPHQGLSALIQALSSYISSPGARQSVIAAIGSYGPVAAPYISVLEAAKQQEENPSVLAELDRTLSQVRK